MRHGERRTDVQVLAVANSVTRAMQAFRFTISCTLQNPEHLPLAQADEAHLVPWDKLPTECQFKIVRPQTASSQRRATAADKLSQQRDFQRYVDWAESSAVTQEELHSAVRGVPSKKARNSRGILGIPQAMKKYQCSARMHAVLACRALAYSRAAAAAGALVGGDALATDAVAQMQRLLGSTDVELSGQCFSIPHSFHDGLGVGTGIIGASCIPGLFEWWMYGRAAALLGPTFVSLWSTISLSVNSTLPPSLTFSLDDDTFLHDLPLHIDMSKLSRGEKPLFTAWWTFAWECLLLEVQERYGDQHKLIFQHKECTTDESPVHKCQLTMRQFCERVHTVPSTAEERQVWTSELHALHGHLHEKVLDRCLCPICGQDGGAIRIRRDARLSRQEWNAAARTAMWQATQKTVQRYGVG
eukprot:9891000-Karenia_brevis.AAC.1